MAQGAQVMAKQAKPTGSGAGRAPDELVQIAFKVQAKLKRRAEATAEALGLDLTNLMRSMLVKYLPAYEAEAEAIRQQPGSNGHGP